MLFFNSTVCGYPAKTVFDCESSISTVSPSFGSMFNLRRNSSTPGPVSVVTSKGVFCCLINLVPEPADAEYDLKLGRDWSNYCTTSVPDAKMPLSDDICLVFYYYVA